MKRATQTRVVLELLRQGPKFSGELEDAGVGRPNSRVAQLRDRGHQISCEHVKVAGGTRYRYALIFDAERDSAPVAAPLQYDPTEPAAGARPAAGEISIAGSGRVLHIGACAWWNDGACDCAVGIALEEAPRADSPPVVGASSSAAPRQDAAAERPTDGSNAAAGPALDIRDQLAVNDEAELLALFGGGA